MREMDLPYEKHANSTWIFAGDYALDIGEDIVQEFAKYIVLYCRERVSGKTEVGSDEALIHSFFNVVRVSIDNSNYDVSFDSMVTALQFTITTGTAVDVSHFKFFEKLALAYLENRDESDDKKQLLRLALAHIYHGFDKHDLAIEHLLKALNYSLNKRKRIVAEQYESAQFQPAHLSNLDFLSKGKCLIVPVDNVVLSGVFFISEQSRVVFKPSPLVPNPFKAKSLISGRNHRNIYPIFSRGSSPFSITSTLQTLSQQLQDHQYWRSILLKMGNDRESRAGLYALSGFGGRDDLALALSRPESQLNIAVQDMQKWFPENVFDELYKLNVKHIIIAHVQNTANLPFACLLHKQSGIGLIGRFIVSEIGGVTLLKRRANQIDELRVCANPSGDLVNAEFEGAVVQSLARINGLSVASSESIENLFKSNIAHYAGHFKIDFDNVEKSAFVMENGISELINLRHITRAPSLLILAGCQTHISYAQEHVLPTPSVHDHLNYIFETDVISTVWKVPDLSASILMMKFWTLHIIDKTRPKAALSMAQDWLSTATKADLINHMDYWLSLLDDDFSGLEPIQKSIIATILSVNIDTPFSEPVHWAGFKYTELIPV